MTATVEAFADYRVVASLGGGGHARYYQAITPPRLRAPVGSAPAVDAEHVVLKVYSTPCGAEAFDRAVHELRAYAATESPHLARVHDAVLLSQFFYAMEYFPLGSLAGPSRPERRHAVQALVDAARGAHDLHERGIVHGDITPSRILLIDNGGRLSGVGLTRVLSSSTAVLGTGPAGQLDYVDPATLVGQRHSRATDIWALGACLNRVLSGEGLYGDLQQLSALQAIRTIQSTTPVISARLTAAERDVVGEALAPVDDRVPTAAELADRIESLL
jgi:serine/threonine protein kinase